MRVSISDLYLAYRQAKVSLFYERRGVGLLQLAKFEDDLEANLRRLREVLMRKPWFDDIPMGEIWVVPKRLRHAEQADAVVRIGGATAGQNHAGLDIQLRCSPTPEFAIVEVLYLWQFGPVLDAQLSREVLGYRLDLRQGELRKNSRWLFEYWPKRYEAFRRAPLRAALKELRRPGGSVVVLSADFAGYYDTIHSGFMLDEEFVDTLHLPSSGERSVATYRRATASLLNAQARFRADAGALTGEPWNAGIPIGPLTSRLVANLALSSFDQALSANQNLLCYRRYVDDMVVVARADKDAPVEFGEAVTSLIPRAQADGDTFTIEAAQLGRARCEFALQKKKMRVHHLSGIQGQTFIGAVAADFQRLVSERRAFLDPSALIEDTAKHMIRAGGGVGSPLRVLRDADRARLERFSLGTSLQSLERISALVNRREARTHVRATLDGVIRVLDSEDNWAENLDLLVRLLRLAVGTSDAESTTELLARMDALWGDVDALQRSTKKLFHRQREIHVPRAWVRLRNYLHERRHEALIDSLPPATPPSRLGDVLGTGLLVGTERVRASALLRRARLLAASDLRMRDREDDAFGPNARDSTSRDWMRGALRAPDLVARMNSIETFLDRVRSETDPWRLAPARLFLCTRPPSYFDIARRFLAKVEDDGFGASVFVQLLDAVNAVRGTAHQDAVGRVVDPRTVMIPSDPPVVLNEQLAPIDPKLILGNLVATNAYWFGAVKKKPVHSKRRLQGLAHVLAKADIASRQSKLDGTDPASLLVLPELSLPRAWFRAVASYVVKLNQHGLVVGLEYEHHPNAIVENQVHAVLPGLFRSTATWSWTKGFPAHEEGLQLAAVKPQALSFRAVPPRGQRPRRIVVRSAFGDFSVLICSELLETPRIADLLSDVELLLAPSWNTDTASYDHVVQTVGMHLGAIVAIANNGHYSDCRAWAPRAVRWQRDLCRLIERDVDSVVTFELPLASLRAFRSAPRALVEKDPDANGSDWRPLPPDWP